MAGTMPFPWTPEIQMQKLVERRPQKQTLNPRVQNSHRSQKDHTHNKSKLAEVKSKSLPLSCWIRGRSPVGTAAGARDLRVPWQRSSPRACGWGVFRGGAAAPSTSTNDQKNSFLYISLEGFGFLNYIFSENTNNSWVFSNTWIIQAGTEIAKSSGPSSS